MFFIYGIEQVPLPVGAILFKEEGILSALLLLFVFSVPLLIYNHDNLSWSFLQKNTSLDTSNIPEISKQPQTIASEEWEEATIEDLESGSYEPV